MAKVSPPPAPKPEVVQLVDTGRETLGRIEPLEARLDERCPPDSDGAVEYECYPKVKPTYQELMKHLEDVRQIATKCLQEDRQDFSCHLLLGTTYAKLARWTGDEERYPRLGADHYRQFLKFSPKDHPKRSQVERMLKGVR
jgi:hypothetical protein